MVCVVPHFELTVHTHSPCRFLILSVPVYVHRFEQFPITVSLEFLATSTFRSIPSARGFNAACRQSEVRQSAKIVINFQRPEIVCESTDQQCLRLHRRPKSDLRHNTLHQAGSRIYEWRLAPSSAGLGCRTRMRDLRRCRHSLNARQIEEIMRLMFDPTIFVWQVANASGSRTTIYEVAPVL